MPDRAVVDKVWCRGCGNAFPPEQIRTYLIVRDGGDEYPGSPLCAVCLVEHENDDDVEDIVEETPAPRAVVAISEDEKWLVRFYRGLRCWVIYDECHWGYQEHSSVADTGQDAHEVLAAFLEGRRG